MGRAAVDTFYYIMDYSGHYYTLDAKKQLVVASDENEAFIFSFAEANEKISAGSKSKFYYMTPIHPEDEKEDEVGREKAETYNFPETNLSLLKELSEEEAIGEIKKSISEYDFSKIDWQEYLTHFSFIVSGLKEYRESLLKAESDVDKKICDVLHYIELCTMEDSEAADLVELLKICRENRRDIKDEIFKVDMFRKEFGTSANVAKAKEAIKSIKGLETRKYKPRKFTELFEGSQMQIKSRESKRADICESLPMQIEENIIKEEYEMNYERRETSFDGKENDWMAFAMQQAEFYRNAGQYIVNLKMDIEDMDNAIFDLMEEVENANCNVTQGYKMFKRLKDLRLKRKEKQKELECLYILTEHFDLAAMSDECDSNIEALEDFLYKDKDDIRGEISISDRSDDIEDNSDSMANIAV